MSPTAHSGSAGDDELAKGAADGPDQWVDLDSITQPVRIRKADGTVVQAQPVEIEQARKGLGMAVISVVVVLVVIVVSLVGVGLVFKHHSAQSVEQFKASDQHSSTTSANQVLSFDFPSNWKDNSMALSPTTSRVQRDAPPPDGQRLPHDQTSIAGVSLLEQTSDVPVADLQAATHAAADYSAALAAKRVTVDATGTGCVAGSAQPIGAPTTVGSAHAAAVKLSFTCQGIDDVARQVWQLRGYFPGPVQQGRVVPGRMFVLTYYGQQKYWTINGGLLDRLGSSVRLDGQPVTAVR